MATEFVQPGLISVGYGGRRLSSLIELLAANAVELLVDVRLSARSAIPGFSASSLGRALGAAGIEYRHVASLGNPEDNRSGFRDGQLAGARARYDEVVSSNSGQAAIRDLMDLLRSHRIALLCAERDQARCHRHLIIEYVRELQPDLDLTVLS
jgi:uncharacterized protein (DUF488 family)